MLEPQSTALFVLLMLVFFGLLGWLAVTKQPVLRVFAAALAFIPASLFGASAVNKYYDYYQTWGALAADLGNQGAANGSAFSSNLSGPGLSEALRKVKGGKIAAEQGETVQLRVTGVLSHITRTVYVYLPPQYFQQAYGHYRFPAIELIHGFPGEPQDWITVVGITKAYATLLHDGAAKPAALIMPDANGGMRISLQCLNVVRGPKDATFLGVDVPNALSRSLRLQPPGRAWGIAGYSEGGFCAANLALQYPARYGFVGVLSGYFSPLADQIGYPPRTVEPFGSNVRLREKNTPIDRVSALPLNVRIPKFWLGVGNYDRHDVAAARAFQQRLLPRQPNVRLVIEQGGSHNMATWRALAPSLLEWLTGWISGAAGAGGAGPAAPSGTGASASAP